MKKVVLYCIFSFFAVSLTAQRPKACKYATDRYDDMLHVTIVETAAKVKNTFTGPNMSFVFQKRIHRKDTSQTLEVIWYELGYSSMVVPAKSPLLVKLRSDTLLRLYSRDVYAGKLERDGVSSTLLRARYDISASDLALLMQEDVVKVRLYLTKEYVEVETVKPEYAAEVRSAVKCIVRY